MSALFCCWLFSSQLVADSHPFDMTPETAQILRNGLNRMYHYDLKEADNSFDDLIRRFPDHPIGYMHKAELIWWKALMDTKNEGLIETFRRYNEQALLKGVESLARDPKDFYALLYLAGTYGNQTRFNIYISKSYFGAMSSGLKGYKYIHSAYTLRPGYVDCLIGLGAYNYFAGAVPLVIKPFVQMFSTPGNKTEGIKQLEQVAVNGEFGQIEARTVLLGVYLNEKKWGDYRRILRQLIAEFPSNPVFYAWLAAPFINQKRWGEGIQQFSELIDPTHSNGGRAGQGYAFYQMGRLELEKGDYESAIKSFTRILEMHSEDENLLARTHLLRAYANDLLGNRDSALADYRATLGLPNVEDTHRKAQQFVGSPYLKPH
jgi:tetratricopeptide (TPR) repeat protein